MDCSPPGSSVHGLLQARILEWVAIPCSSRSSWRRDRTQVSCIAGRFFTIWAPREAPEVTCLGPVIMFIVLLLVCLWGQKGISLLLQLRAFWPSWVWENQKISLKETLIKSQQHCFVLWWGARRKGVPTQWALKASPTGWPQRLPDGAGWSGREGEGRMEGRFHPFPSQN